MLIKFKIVSPDGVWFSKDWEEHTVSTHHDWLYGVLVQPGYCRDKDYVLLHEIEFKNPEDKEKLLKELLVKNIIQ